MTSFIILSEKVVGTLLIHTLFGYSTVVSGLVALSFTTVREVIFVPILEEFRLVTT